MAIMAGFGDLKDRVIAELKRESIMERMGAGSDTTLTEEEEEFLRAVEEGSDWLAIIFEKETEDLEDFRETLNEIESRKRGEENILGDIADALRSIENSVGKLGEGADLNRTLLEIAGSLDSLRKALHDFTEHHGGLAEVDLQEDEILLDLVNEFEEAEKVARDLKQLIDKRRERAEENRSSSEMLWNWLTGESEVADLISEAGNAVQTEVVGGIPPAQRVETVEENLRLVGQFANIRKTVRNIVERENEIDWHEREIIQELASEDSRLENELESLQGELDDRQEVHREVIQQALEGVENTRKILELAGRFEDSELEEEEAIEEWAEGDIDTGRLKQVLSSHTQEVDFARKNFGDEINRNFGVDDGKKKALRRGTA